MAYQSNNYKSGHFAELLARCFLRFKGYRILAQNYVTGKGTNAGEVDFVAKRGRVIAFVEVKKRKTIDDAAYSISEHQKQRIRRGAESFLKYHQQYQTCDIRFDAVLVKLPLHLKHIKNAW